MYIVMMKSKTA